MPKNKPYTNSQLLEDVRGANQDQRDMMEKLPDGEYTGKTAYKKPAEDWLDRFEDAAYNEKFIIKTQDNKIIPDYLNIENFIRKEIERVGNGGENKAHRGDEITYNISLWKAIGNERGYLDFIKDEIRKEMTKDFIKLLQEHAEMIRDRFGDIMDVSLFEADVIDKLKQ